MEAVLATVDYKVISKQTVGELIIAVKKQLNDPKNLFEPLGGPFYANDEFHQAMSVLDEVEEA